MNQQDKQVRQADVVVVGAGFAGLSAARALVETGVDVIVLEARDRVGGRSYTRLASDGTPIDLGGQWIGPTQDRLAALAEAVGVTTFPTYNEGKNIEYQHGQRMTYEGAISTVDPLVTMETVETILNLNMMANEVPLDAPWNASEAAEWDAQTVATWMNRNIESEQVRNLFTLGVQAVFSVEPQDLSFLHFLFYVHSGGNLNQLLSVARGAQERRFHGGSQSIANVVAQELGERVMLSAPVHTITQDAGGVHVEGDNVVVSAQRAIIAIPPTLAGRLRYRPALPGYRDQLTQRMPMGTIIKVHCLYATPFWRDEGFSGQVTSFDGIVRVTFDNSPESGRPGILMGFIEGNEARIWGRRSLEERRAAVLACLVRYFGDKAAQPYEYIEQNWADEEYTRGCYAGVMIPGGWTTYGEALRAPIGRLHWAGTETATVWNGYLDGAIQSGQRAAVEVLEAIDRLSMKEG
jgi:monoamine oxidase